MPNEKKTLEIETVASTNEGVDVDLFRDFQALTESLDPSLHTTGLQYSLRRAFEQRAVAPETEGKHQVCAGGGTLRRRK